MLAMGIGFDAEGVCAINKTVIRKRIITRMGRGYHEFVTLEETLQTLKAAGTVQTRKTYLRHGYPEDTYGVSFADMKKFAKKIDTDHALAQKLWATGNGDACVLATMIADPDETTAKELDAWAKAVKFSLMSQMLSRFVIETEFAHAKAEQWTKSPDEWIGEVGYHVLGQLALRDEELPDEYFEGHLKTIEKNIKSAKNFTRSAMNQTVIAIGVRNPNLTNKALAAAARIGKVDVDHGDTACQTPDAAAYIQKTLARASEPKDRPARPKK
jgi:3-methyladenine DNA glycosylase AlkD